MTIQILMPWSPAWLIKTILIVGHSSKFMYNPYQQIIRSAICIGDPRSFHQKVKGLVMLANGSTMQVVDKSDWPPS